MKEVEQKEAVVMDPRLVDVVERMLDRCGRGQQVQGFVIPGVQLVQNSQLGNATPHLLHSVADCGLVQCAQERITGLVHTPAVAKRFIQPGTAALNMT